MKKTKNILVTGGNGQLGKTFSNLSKKHPNYNFIFTDIDDFNITNKKDTLRIVEKTKPDYIVNCAAYTAVDKAETEKKLALDVNFESVKNLATTCKHFGIHFIHFSTDYVYDGSKNTPYTEESSTNPKNIYGQSKLLGEKAIIDSGCYYTIIRTSWLYSQYGQNFVKTILKAASKNDILNVVFDQIGSPTFCGDLASIVLCMIEEERITKTKEIFLYSNEGVASWYDFAFQALRINQSHCKVKPIESAQFPTKAKRPNYSCFNKEKIKNFTKLQIPHWVESLEKCVKLLNEQSGNRKNH
ncbi:MAG: dTDP-4-dehydrorhamnose reductase [Bacteroidales bacterium]